MQVNARTTCCKTTPQGNAEDEEYGADTGGRRLLSAVLSRVKALSRCCWCYWSSTHNGSFAGTTSETLTHEDIMKRNARRHLVQDVTTKFNDALDMYHARQEKWEEEHVEEEEEHVHIGEAASMVSMFKQAAAGAIGDGEGEGDDNTTAVATDENPNFDDFEEGVHVDGLHAPHMTAEERAVMTLELLAMPRIQQYLAHQLRLVARDMKRDQVEQVDMAATFVGGGEEEQGEEGKKSKGAEATADANALVKFKASLDSPDGGDTQRQREMVNPKILGRKWEEKGMPVPEMYNVSNWRPPSSPSHLPEVETGGLTPLLSPTHSRPTTREVLDKRPSSPWKEKEFKFISTKSKNHLLEEEMKQATIPNQSRKIASLDSLQFDESHYKNHRARMAQVPGSGYGQKDIEAKTRAVLGVI